ncbi:SPFH domain-containing protein [Denitrobaculum tricleocarpae]|uniref:Band 7 protein n=1 Tax=Denitrobaculum tricleocarpae TaxID=2591009 RepID=A0A545TMR9_9PROT|nr:SPFH domain-containing protein [Denitrobaculum tricleocarpae]TQV78468.1 band 7 protein [Denitrobaculum tricleocarpae]
MAQIKKYPLLSQLRSEASSYVQYFRKGKTVRAGRGLSFWFDPTGASISEIPMDDRELNFMIKGQSSDYQDLAVQGVVSWRVVDAQRLGERVDFSIDLKSGRSAGKPQDQIRSVLNGLVREFADTHLKKYGVRELLEKGLAPLQAAINAGFTEDPTLTSMGLEIVSVRVAALTPSSELSRALQAPTFESLQQKADEATFSRRALAVEKERAIAENELNNQVELAARRKELIAREDANARSEAEALAAASRITVEADAEAKIVTAEAEARRIRSVEQAAADMETARMSAYGSVPPAVLYALAAQEFAGKLERIDSLTVSPDMLAGIMNQIKSLVGSTEAQG